MDTSYEAIHGEVTITVTPGTTSDHAEASVRPRNVEFESGPSHVVVLDELVIEDVTVGWFPR